MKNLFSLIIATAIFGTNPVWAISSSPYDMLGIGPENHDQVCKEFYDTLRPAKDVKDKAGAFARIPYSDQVSKCTIGFGGETIDINGMDAQSGYIKAFKAFCKRKDRILVQLAVTTLPGCDGNLRTLTITPKGDDKNCRVNIKELDISFPIESQQATRIEKRLNSIEAIIAPSIARNLGTQIVRDCK
jgi:hypothetical protein